MPPRRPVVELSLLVAAVVLVAACFSTSEEFPDDTARVELSDRSYELEIISCGQDEDLGVFLLGAQSADSFLQLLLTIDGERVDIAASAVSFETRDTGVLAAGDDALLASREVDPGEIELASIRGDRIDVEAEVEPIGADRTGDGSAAPLDLVARCAAVGEVALADRGPGTFEAPVPTTTKGMR